MSDDDVIVTGASPARQVDPAQQLVLCKICWTREVTQILLPCRHACLCTTCLDHLDHPRNCPVCDTVIFRSLTMRIDCG
jgi:hypothetical protein